MLVLDERIEGGLARRAPAPRRSTARARTRRTPPPARPRRATRASPRCAGPCRRSRGGASSTRAGHARPSSSEPNGRGRDPEPPEELLLVEPVLADLERARRQGRRARCEPALDGDVLELVGDDVRAVGELARRSGSSKAPTISSPTSPAHARRRGRGSEAGRERRAREREHAPELPAAEDADERRHAAGIGRCENALGLLLAVRRQRARERLRPRARGSRRRAARR